MSNLEKIVNEFIPAVTKLSILTGIVLCLESITIAVYNLLKKKQTIKEVGIYLAGTLIPGVMLCISALLVNSIAQFDIDYSSYKYTVPLGYGVSLIVFYLIKKQCK